MGKSYIMRTKGRRPRFCVRYFVHRKTMECREPSDPTLPALVGRTDCRGKVQRRSARRHSFRSLQSFVSTIWQPKKKFLHTIVTHSSIFNSRQTPMFKTKTPQLNKKLIPLTRFLLQALYSNCPQESGSVFFRLESLVFQGTVTSVCSRSFGNRLTGVFSCQHSSVKCSAHS